MRLFEQQQLTDRVCCAPGPAGWLCEVRSEGEQMAEQRDGEAQGRVDWKRNGWPDAKFEGTSAKCDLRNEQQREKREESRERREKREESREG